MRVFISQNNISYRKYEKMVGLLELNGGHMGLHYYSLDFSLCLR